MRCKMEGDLVQGPSACGCSDAWKAQEVTSTSTCVDDGQGAACEFQFPSLQLCTYDMT